MGVEVGRGRERDSGKRPVPWETRIMYVPGSEVVMVPPPVGAGVGALPLYHKDSHNRRRRQRA